MLQPRRIVLLLTLHCVLGIAEDVFRDPDDGRGGPSLLDRTKRETPEVSTILLIDNDGEFGKAGKPAGLLTSTARTFVNEGTTTEYATQIIGTTLDNGRLYAQILQTTSRVYFGDQKYKPVKNTVESFIKPTEPVFVFPSKALDVNLNLLKPAKDVVSEALLKTTEEQLYAGKNIQLALASAKDDEKELLENVIRSRKLDNKRNAEVIKPTKVFAGFLPTFTVKHDFAPSGFSVTPVEHDKEEKKEEKNKLRLGKNLFAKPVQAKFDTVTYAGFADFTTTVANTVIVFTPHTNAVSEPQQPVPSMSEQPKVMTNVKTFMSHSPGMVTKTVPGHDISMQTAIPTLVADRKSKGVPDDVLRSSFLAQEQDQFSHPSTNSIEPSVFVQPSEMEEFVPTSTSAQPTEPLATYATTVTRSFNQAGVGKPLGLLKSIGGTQAYDGTTTHFTSLIYGTYVGNTYTQVLQTSSNSFFISESNGKKATVYFDAPTTTSEPSTETEEEEELLTTGDDTPVTEESVAPVESAEKETPIEPTDEVVSRVVPSTVYKTFTYLTTFFIPADETSTTTSIRSREVVTSEVTYVTKVIDGDWMESLAIEPTEVNLVENTDIIEPEFELPAVRVLAPETVPTTTEEPAELETTIFMPKEETTTASEVAVHEQIIETSAPETTVHEQIIETSATETTAQEEIIETSAPETTVQEQINETSAPETTSSSTPPSTTTTSTTTTTTSTTTTTTEAPPPDPTTDDKVLSSTPTEIRPDDDEEEIEVIYKTLYTTYTYLTTFFHETTTSVSSSEEVVTNIITSTLSEIHPTSSSQVEPTNSVSLHEDEVTSVPAGSGETLYTTYTYFTTLFDDGSTSVISRTDVHTNIAPTPTASALPASILADEELFKAKFEMLLREQQALKAQAAVSEQQITSPESTTLTTSPSESTTEQHVEEPPLSIRPTSVLKRNKYGTITRKLKRPVKLVPSEVSEVVPSQPQSTPRLEKGGRTVVRKRLKTKSRLLPKSTTVIDEQAGVTIIHLDPRLPNTDSLERTSVADVARSTSKGNRQVKRIAPPEPIHRARKVDAIYDDQVLSETNNEEIRPSASPTILLQTSFTTFTYFTTVYKGSTSSDIISRLETITNVVTETVAPNALLTPSLSPEDATLPITYFTTFTYWTTLYREGSTVVTSREETISNVVTPTIEATSTIADIESTSSATIDPTIVQPVAPSVFVPGFIPAETTTPSELETASSASISTKPIEDVTDPIILKNGIDDRFEPTTYYTTYTYFTTSYVGDSTVVKSRLETVTSVINSSSHSLSDVENNDLQTGRAINPGNANKIEPTAIASLKTGLLSTVVSSAVNDGKTTVYSTDIFGTYIDGLYAKVLESTTKVLTASEITPKPVLSADAQKTGIVSINEGKIVDADGISTTFFTTKAIGTSIENLYAQVVESTSSVLVDNDKKSALASISPAANDIFKTGLVRLIEGSIVKDDTTTLYESRVIGTVIDGRYAQIIESTSSYKILPTATQSASVQPTLSASITTASPAVIQSSEPEDEDKESEEEDDDDSENDSGRGRPKNRLSFQQKKKTFTPVIRPFASRSRPTFLPKKKTGGLPSAQTVTPSKFTPTITATLATKSEGFAGTSRNRFSGRRSSSSLSTEVKPTASSSRKFSGRSKTSSSALSSSSSSRGRSSSRISATPALNLSSTRGRTFRGSSSQLSSDSPRSSIAPARPRIRPTLSGLPGRFSSSTTPQPPKVLTPEPATVDDEYEDTENDGEEIDEAAVQTTTTTTTTTEDPNSSRRNGNPLLRFRRPPVPRVTTNKPVETTTVAPRRSALTSNRNRPKTTTTTSPAPSTTRRTRPASSFGNRAQLPNRPRPVNNLFPPRSLKKQAEEVPENEEIVEEELEYEDDSSVEESSPAEKLVSSKQDRRLGLERKLSRTKRQTEYGSRSRNGASSRYSRPTPRSTQAKEKYDYYDYDYIVTEPPKVTPRSRGRSRQSSAAPYVASTTSAPRIRPSQTTARTQFTLRKDDTTTASPRNTNFRRPTTPRRRTNYKTTEAPTTARKPTRLRPQTTLPSSQRRGFSNSRSRTSTTRTRGRFDDDILAYQPVFDGTITVTHKVPSEVTIPFVNGKVTEYRNVITAKPSLQTLGPHQYTVTSTNGGTLLFLNNEVTSTLSNGAVEVTRFLVHETPTTSVTFTPTTIRGRKTSYSHVIPSTVYEVENLVSTLQPSLSSPLANILLSQLLLGNLNLPQNGQQPTGPPTPMTEYRTKTTTYVTSVTQSQSTVIPLTFRGKEILTTILDSSVNVITATEFITDTIVTTPSVAPVNQFNSLLLPALLQAQLLQTSAPTLPITPQHALNSLQLDDKAKNNALRESDEILEEEKEEIIDRPRPKSRKNVAAQPSQQVVTLYVSGRRPGEFSTILSTVDAADSTVRKREALLDDIERLLVEASEVKQVRVLASQLPSLERSSDVVIDSGMSEVFIPVSSSENFAATESLESVVGDITLRPTEVSSPLATSRPLAAKVTKKYSNLSKSARRES